MKKQLLALLLLLATVISLVACNKDGTHSDSEGETEPAAPHSVISIEELKKYTIIRPEHTDSQLTNIIGVLRQEILDYTGVDLKIKTDFYREGFDGLEMGEYEILVGETNREESIDYLSSIRYSDYGYKFYGKKLVIAGQNERNSLLAVRKFVNDVIGKEPAADGVFLYSDKAEAKVDGKYTTEGGCIGGADVFGMKVVYPEKGKNYEDELAESLALHISECYGYRVFAVSDKSALKEDGSYILLGDVKDTAGIGVPSDLNGDESFLGVNGKVLLLTGGDALGLYNAVNKLKDDLTASAGKSLELSGEERFTVTSSTLSSMSFNLWVSEKSAERTARVVEMIRKYMPDTFGVQEASPAWMSDLKKMLPMYACVGDGRDGGSKGEHSAVFYLKDKFTLVESDTKWLSETPDVPSKIADAMYNRIYTYAVLKRNSDGKQFVHINTHFDHKGDEARMKQADILTAAALKFKDMPTVITGDFNAKLGSTPYQTMLKNFKNAALVADDSKNTGTFISSGAIIDYIFVSPGNVKVLKYKVCNEKIDGEYPSDHFPILATYVLG